MDVFTSLTGLLIAVAVVAAVFAGVGSAFGVGGLHLFRRSRSKSARE